MPDDIWDSMPAEERTDWARKAIEADRLRANKHELRIKNLERRCGAIERRTMQAAEPSPVTPSELRALAIRIERKLTSNASHLASRDEMVNDILQVLSETNLRIKASQ